MKKRPLEELHDVIYGTGQPSEDFPDDDWKWLMVIFAILIAFVLIVSSIPYWPRIVTPPPPPPECENPEYIVKMVEGNGWIDRERQTAIYNSGEISHMNLTVSIQRADMGCDVDGDGTLDATQIVVGYKNNLAIVNMSSGEVNRVGEILMLYFDEVYLFTDTFKTWSDMLRPGEKKQYNLSIRFNAEIVESMNVGDRYVFLITSANRTMEMRLVKM